MHLEQMNQIGVDYVYGNSCYPYSKNTASAKFKNSRAIRWKTYSESSLLSWDI